MADCSCTIFPADAGVNLRKTKREVMAMHIPRGCGHDADYFTGQNLA